MKKVPFSDIIGKFYISENAAAKRESCTKLSEPVVRESDVRIAFDAGKFGAEDVLSGTFNAVGNLGKLLSIPEELEVMPFE